jgi:hypothetical protein
MTVEPLQPYRFRPFEPGIFVEIYLPKKARYQGALYEALSEGFNFEKVRNHFADPTKEARIRTLLTDYTEWYDPPSIGVVEQFYWGYSMYEVDGVFFSPRTSQAIEERTQVIRLMCFPDLDRATAFATKDGIERGTVRRIVAAMMRRGRDERDRLGAEYPLLLDYIDRWIGAVGLFIFGYLIFNLCERIRALNEEGAASLEEEIWVSSFWNLEVNKVSLESTMR